MHACGELVVERYRPEGTRPAEPDEDDPLWRAAARGERGAFESLVRRHRGKVTSIAARLLDRREDVEDAVQEAFLRAYRQLPRFRGECGFRSWLVAILVNVCRTRRRGFGRWRRFLS